MALGAFPLTPSMQSSQSSQPAPDLHILWVEVHTGQAGADERLFKEVHKRAFPVALRKIRNREDAEEAAADCATKVWSRAKVDDPPANVNAWVYVVAVNAAYDKLRKLGRQLPEQRGDGPEIGVHSPNYENEIDRQRLIERLNKCVGEIENDKYREALLLRGIEGMSLKEMAEKMGFPEETAKNYYYRGIAALQKCLKDREESKDRNVKKDGRV